MAKNGESMPKHQYVPDPRIPCWVNRILAHPFETVIALIALLFGVSLLSLGFQNDETPSKSLQNLTVELSFILGVFSLIGGVTTIIGAHWRSEDIGKGWLIERSGLIGIGSSFFVYGISVIYSYPESWFSWLQPLMISFACVLRVVALTLTKRWTKTVRRSREGRYE